MRILLIVTCFLFHGCAAVYMGTKNIPPSFSFDSSDGQKGIVMGSIIIDGLRPNLMDRMMLEEAENYSLYFKKVTEEVKGMVKLSRHWTIKNMAKMIYKT